MSEEELKTLIKQQMQETLIKELDSSLIFIYIQKLEQKNKELEENLKIATAMLTKGTYPEQKDGDNDFNKQFIAVDKIKEIKEKYEKMVEGTFTDTTWRGQNRRDNCYEIIGVLKELLEEE